MASRWFESPFYPWFAYPTPHFSQMVATMSALFKSYGWHHSFGSVAFGGRLGILRSTWGSSGMLAERASRPHKAAAVIVTDDMIRGKA